MTFVKVMGLKCSLHTNYKKVISDHEESFVHPDFEISIFQTAVVSPNQRRDFICVV